MFLKAGSGCGQDRVSGCRGAGAGGTGRESDAGRHGHSGAGLDLHAVIPSAVVFIEPGCPGQQRGKPGSTLRSCWPRVSYASQYGGPLCCVSCERPTGEKSSPREAEPQQVIAGLGVCGGTVRQGTWQVPNRWDGREAEPWLAAEGMAVLSRCGGDREFSTGVWTRPKLLGVRPAWSLWLHGGTPEKAVCASRHCPVSQNRVLVCLGSGGQGC